MPILASLNAKNRSKSPFSIGELFSIISEFTVLYWWKTETSKVSRLPTALAYGLIRRGRSPANLASARRALCYGRLAGAARSRRRRAGTADKGYM
jgi:hypothetical protein